MKQLGVDLTLAFGQEPLYHMDTVGRQQHPLILALKTIWAENADVISMHYAGTGSVISEVTKKGTKDLAGMFDHASKTLTRFWVNNFEDQVKQETIDMLLGEHTESCNGNLDKFLGILTSFW